jgi:diaminopimelate decarboxylase
MRPVPLRRRRLPRRPRPRPAPGALRTPPGEGYLVGAYCIEGELLTWRRLRLPQGAAVGDIIAFVNTAGYQMHILESASHQISLARNLVPLPDGGWQLDAIEL